MDTSSTGYPYSPAWRAWRDPEPAEYLDPTALLLDRHLSARGDHTALLVDGRPVSYRALAARVAGWTAGWRALGLVPDQRVLFFATDSLDFIAAWLGAIRAGLIPAVVSDRYKAEQLAYFLGDTGARALFLDAAQWDKLAAVQPPATLAHVVVHGGPVPARLPGATVHAAEELLAAQPSDAPATLRHRNDMAYFFYSGGTTGTAKGIVHLTHDFVLVPERHGAFWHYRASDVVYATSKKYFTHGLWPGVLIPLYFGATAILHAEPARGPLVLDILEQHGVTKWITVPTVVKDVLLHLEQTGRRVQLSRLELAVSASEKMPPELFERFYRQFGLELLDSIGSSEVTYEWIANRPEEFRRGSLGKPVFGCEIRLVGDDGQPVREPGQSGEAWVKSRTAGLFYWRKFDRTKETFVGEWTRTGDVLSYDADGFFWFGSRADDVFKVRGLWVSPIEVEAAITEHPAVLEAAVIPAFDPQGGTEVKACVVLRPGHSPSEALSEALRERVRPLGGYKVPSRIEYLERLPRTTLDKIDRRALRQRETGLS